MRILILLLPLFCSLTYAKQKIVCVSWMDHKIEIKESPVSDYAMATIDFEQGDWAYKADFLEGRFNYLTIFYKPLKLASSSRSLSSSLNELSAALDIEDNPNRKQATVDCDLREAN